MENYIPRALNLPELIARKSHFLFGPRQTGKTSLILNTLKNARVYDLLDSAVLLSLSRNLKRLEEELAPADQFIVIDEIQRLPELLNEVHRLIETRGIKFLLTGSSARKLRRGGINLLGGRARTRYLHPLCYAELRNQYDLRRAAARGLLPSIYFSDDPQADLEAYSGAYLQEEIISEGITRNLPAFSRFLEVAAHCHGTIVNFTQVSSDAQVARTTIHEYFHVLKDTLILHELPAWRKSKKRKPLASSKFYFFDIGVVASLQGKRFRPGTPDFGPAFETLLLHEMICRRDYEGGPSLSFWRSASGYEVDFVLDDHTAVEVKAKENVSARDLRPLIALKEEVAIKRAVCVTMEPRPRRVEGIELLPWKTFLEALWGGDFSR